MKKIMVVDDEKDVRYSLKRIFEEKGEKFEVIEAENGQKAIDLIKKDKPDLVLLDIMMPILDGWETCEKLKKDKETSKIPVVFLTAKPFSMADVDRAANLGATEYLTKPFDGERLMKLINMHFQ